MTDNLKYLSQKSIDNLYDKVEENLERYMEGDFTDLVAAGGWDIQLSLRVDLSPLKKLVLEKNPDAEIVNSMLVWKTLHELSPGLACEDRLWSRLTHVECLDYARFRWIKKVPEKSLPGLIRNHFFANTQTKCRDDNAISRLWWNAYIARLAAPEKQSEALKLILKSADIRSNFIERTRTSSRPVLAAGIIRLMMSNSWLTEKERNYREFMVVLNRLGGGKVFELWPETKIDEFMSHCSNIAMKVADRV